MQHKNCFITNMSVSRSEFVEDKGFVDITNDEFYWERQSLDMTDQFGSNTEEVIERALEWIEFSLKHVYLTGDRHKPAMFPDRSVTVHRDSFEAGINGDTSMYVQASLENDEDENDEGAILDVHFQLERTFNVVEGDTQPFDL